jgi:hypothetical protein
MESVKIFLSGGMGSLSFEEQNEWRNRVMNAIRYGDYDYEKKPHFFNPVDYYNYKETNHKTEREAMEFDLNALRKSDLVIVNFNDPKSLGSAMELILAKELHIPVIGLNKDGVELHPWLIECCTRICDTMKELVEHVVDYYLN